MFYQNTSLLHKKGTKSSNHANAGLLDCWIAGLLDCWITGLLDLTHFPLYVSIYHNF